MRLRLDDNERGAFHYLFGGVVVVILLKGIAFLADRLGPSLSADQAALRPFQQGYPLLRGELAVVVTPTGLTERLILAVVLAVGATFMLAVLLALLSTAWHRSGGRGRRIAVRLVLMLTLVWSVYAAFLLPIKETRVEKGELLIRERRSFIGDIPWPLSLHERRLSSGEVLWVEGGSDPPVAREKGKAWIDVVTTAGTERAAWVRGLDAKDELELLRAASDGAAVLERELR
jgi:hypothetical protein